MEAMKRSNLYLRCRLRSLEYCGRPDLLRRLTDANLAPNCGCHWCDSAVVKILSSTMWYDKIDHCMRFMIWYEHVWSFCLGDSYAIKTEIRSFFHADCFHHFPLHDAITDFVNVIRRVYHAHLPHIIWLNIWVDLSNCFDIPYSARWRGHDLCVQMVILDGSGACVLNTFEGWMPWLQHVRVPQTQE